MYLGRSENFVDSEFRLVAQRASKSKGSRVRGYLEEPGDNDINRIPNSKSYTP